jgi:protein-S-isoprenylcysteine O-methyltransferase Ste14
MTYQSDPIAALVCLVVLACWMGFAVIVVVGKRGSAKGAAKRDVTSTLGLAVQMAAYTIGFIFFRPYFSPFLLMSKTAEIFLAVITALLALTSTWFCYAAARALGKHWALMARVIEGHELIQSGPFAVVRNPIYFAMLGMLIAVGLAVTRWPTLLAAIVLYLVGTWIRIRAEEKLLRETFGAKFDDYARRVPALLPRLFR